MKRLIAIILLLSTLFACAACQPTPEKPAVQSKANGKMEKALEEEPEELNIATEKHITDEYTAKDKTVTICIDADVKYPEDLKMIEVYEIEPVSVSKELIQKAIDVCMEGNTPYDTPIEYTKEELDVIIKNLEEHLQDDFLQEYYNGDEETIAEVRRDFEAQRKEYLKSYNTAPDKIDKKPVVIEYRPHKYYMTEADYKIKEKDWSGNDRESKELLAHLRSDEPTEFNCMADLDNGFRAAINAYDVNAEDDAYNPFYYTLQRHTLSFTKGKFVRMYDRTIMQWENRDEKHPIDVTLSEEEAKALAQKLVDDLGLSDDLIFTYAQKTEATEGGENKAAVPQGKWIVQYRRRLGPIILCRTQSVLFADGLEEYRGGVNDEELNIYITDDGIAAWDYIQPFERKKTVNEGVKLLDFDKMLELYRQQSSLTYISYLWSQETEPEVMEEVYAAKTEVNIDTIELRAMRLVQKNNTSKYIVTPCWSFEGEKISYDENGDVIYRTNVAMFINALDGTQIHAEDCR